MTRFVVTGTQFGANMRSGPSEHSNVIVNLPFSTVVDTTQSTDSKWKEVKAINGPHSGQRGFVSDVNLTPEKSSSVTRLLSSVAHYWGLFERGAGKEDKQPFKGHVLTMWDELGVGRPPDDNTSHRDWPWSAAAISSFVRRAGGYDGFRFSAGHHAFIKDSVRQREAGNTGAPFWGHRLNEVKPEPGDLVVEWFGQARTYDWVSSIASSNTTFRSHTDVVCEVRNDHLWAIGGNTSNSVGRKRYRLDSNGFLAAANRVFMIMKNRR